MKEKVIAFHRLLVGQAFYPLLFSSLVSFGFFLIRVYYTRKLDFLNLVWDLFLAWTPYLLSAAILGWSRARSRAWWSSAILVLLWLVFYPNAPYMMTVFYHLETRNPVPFWYDIFDIGMVVGFAWTGCLLAIVSLRAMHSLVQKLLGRLAGWFFVGLSMILSAIGMYLGRVRRFNSWDIFFRPLAILDDVTIRIIDPIDHLKFVGFVVMFTMLLLVFYLTFVSIQPTKD